MQIAPTQLTLRHMTVHLNKLQIWSSKKAVTLFKKEIDAYFNYEKTVNDDKPKKFPKSFLISELLS